MQQTCTLHSPHSIVVYWHLNRNSSLQTYKLGLICLTWNTL